MKNALHTLFGLLQFFISFFENVHAAFVGEHGMYRFKQDVRRTTGLDTGRFSYVMKNTLEDDSLRHYS